MATNTNVNIYIGTGKTGSVVVNGSTYTGTENIIFSLPQGEYDANITVEGATVSRHLVVPQSNQDVVDALIASGGYETPEQVQQAITNALANSQGYMDITGITDTNISIESVGGKSPEPARVVVHYKDGGTEAFSVTPSVNSFSFFRQRNGFDVDKLVILDGNSNIVDEVDLDFTITLPTVDVTDHVNSITPLGLAINGYNDRSYGFKVTPDDTASRVYLNGSLVGKYPDETRDIVVFNSFRDPNNGDMPVQEFAQGLLEIRDSSNIKLQVVPMDIATEAFKAGQLSQQELYSVSYSNDTVSFVLNQVVKYQEGGTPGALGNNDIVIGEYNDVVVIPYGDNSLKIMDLNNTVLDVIPIPPATIKVSSITTNTGYVTLTVDGLNEGDTIVVSGRRENDNYADLTGNLNSNSAVSIQTGVDNFMPLQDYQIKHNGITLLTFRFGV